MWNPCYKFDRYIPKITTTLKNVKLADEFGIYYEPIKLNLDYNIQCNTRIC